MKSPFKVEGFSIKGVEVRVGAVDREPHAARDFSAPTQNRNVLTSPRSALGTVTLANADQGFDDWWDNGDQVENWGEGLSALGTVLKWTVFLPFTVVYYSARAVMSRG